MIFIGSNDPDEWETAGFAEYFSDDAVCVVEWPERAGRHLPAPDVDIALEYLPDGADQGRILRIAAHSQRGLACVTALDDAA